MNRSIIILLSFLTCVVNAQETSEKELLWNYPVKPGTEEWESFKTGQEKYDACLIPQDVLASLTTKDLAEICMNYPMFLNFIYFNDERKGMSFIIERFNGLKELSVRKDGVQTLINIYRDYPILSEVQYDVSSKDFYTPYRLLYLELLLADDVFMKQLNEQQVAELGKIILNKYEQKLANAHVYSLMNIQKTFLLGAVVIERYRISDKSPEQQNVIRQYIENYHHPDPTLLSEISKIISAL